MKRTVAQAFQTCRIADFQVGSAPERDDGGTIIRPAGLETRDTADLEVDLEVCATTRRRRQDHQDFERFLFALSDTELV